MNFERKTVARFRWPSPQDILIGLPSFLPPPLPPTILYLRSRQRFHSTRDQRRLCRERGEREKERKELARCIIDRDEGEEKIYQVGDFQHDFFVSLNEESCHGSTILPNEIFPINNV